MLGRAVGETARAQPILGSTGAYAVMAGWTVTINGGDTINGNLGAANIGGYGLGRRRAEGCVGGADDRPRKNRLHPDLCRLGGHGRSG